MFYQPPSCKEKGFFDIAKKESYLFHKVYDFQIPEYNVLETNDVFYKIDRQKPYFMGNTTIYDRFDFKNYHYNLFFQNYLKYSPYCS